MSDLVHHVKPLLAVHLASVAAASGMTLAQTGEAFRSLRDDGFRFQRDEVLPLLRGLETIGVQQSQGFELAVTVLLVDALQRWDAAASFNEICDKAILALRDWPATLRAAVANGITQAIHLYLLWPDTPPSDADCLTRDASIIAEPLLRIARSMRPDELHSVSQAYFGRDGAAHEQALRAVIGQQDGIFTAEQVWFPAEVLELASHDPSRPGHAGCTAILLLNVLQKGDELGWFQSCWETQGAVYCGLQPSRRDPILAAIRYIYETDRGFSPEIEGRLGEGAVIPVVEDL